MRVFLAKTKSDASSQFGHFMAWFERNLDCRLQVLRTDGGKEFRQMDLLCERLLRLSIGAIFCIVPGGNPVAKL
jgi:hypothetical protein